MIEKLRLFLVIIEEGSLRRAAERLHISQSAVTRQIQLLEHDLGGQILERASSVVRPTIGGQALARKARGLLADYDSVMAEIRRLVRGESDRLRIGYLASAMQEYFGPALAELRRAYPKLKPRVTDISPFAGLTSLRKLNLSDCLEIGDVSPLAGLISLQTLEITNCPRLRDLSPLASLTSLRMLKLSWCRYLRETVVRAELKISTDSPDAC